MSIILVSSEMPEVLGMSDRILVMHEGRSAQSSQAATPIRNADGSRRRQGLSRGSMTMMTTTPSHTATAPRFKAWLIEQKSLIALLVLILVVSFLSPNFFNCRQLAEHPPANLGQCHHRRRHDAGHPDRRDRSRSDPFWH